MTNTALREVTWNRLGSDEAVELRERITELELQLENSGWTRFSDIFDDNVLSLTAIKAISRQARRFFLKNPIIERGVTVSADYTFGRGVTVLAKDENINAVIQQFLDDPKNKTELTSHQAMLAKDREQQCDGNTFLVFFVQPLTGRVRVRSIPLVEIEDIICNPEDHKDPWYYKRAWSETQINIETGETETKQRKLYYRDWRNQANDKTQIGDTLIEEAAYVMHIKTGAFSDWKFGVSEIYSALDWARAYKSFLSNWATLMEAYARFALKLKTSGGTRGVANARTKLNTSVTPSNGVESNPPATTGSTWIESDLIALDVVKTAGATTKAEEGRRLLLMAWAGMGLPETFGGDVSVGSLATAESLDRPTELKFSNRQEFWQEIYGSIIWFVIEQAVKAPKGQLRDLANTTVNDYDEDEIVFPTTIETRIVVKFPEIINMSIKDNIASIISAATMDGKQIVNFNQHFVWEQLLNALGVDDVDEVITELEADQIEQTEQQNVVDAVQAVERLIESMNKYVTANNN